MKCLHLKGQLRCATVMLACLITLNFMGCAEPKVNRSFTLGKSTVGSVEILQAEAEKGQADAQYLLGIVHYEGPEYLGFTKDYKEAARWEQKAAGQGQRDAQFLLGMMYAEGKGVEQNNTLAAHWQKKAAAQGQPEAENSLAHHYLKGELGFPKDNALFLKWLLKAAKHGNDNAQVALGMIAYQDKLFPVALEWWKGPAEHGNAEAQHNVGLLYAKGQGIEQSDQIAYQWFSLAAKALPDVNEIRAIAKKELTEEQLTIADKWVADWKPASP